MMASDKSKSISARMSVKDAFRYLNLPPSASIEEINQVFKTKLSDLQSKYAEQPDRLAPEADQLYNAYSTAYMSKNGPEEHMLPLTITGPEALLNTFGIQEVPHQSLRVQMQSNAQYKDGKLVKKASSKTESFINKDGKREVKEFENNKLVKHYIDGKRIL